MKAKLIQTYYIFYNYEPNSDGHFSRSKFHTVGEIKLKNRGPNPYWDYMFLSTMKYFSYKIGVKEELKPVMDVMLAYE
jgi:hypothetical protein